MIEVSNRPCVSIRRHRLIDATLDDLADSLSDELARFLRAAVQARLNMIISGGTDAGKTTLLRALTAEADPADRIVTSNCPTSSVCTSWSIAIQTVWPGRPAKPTPKAKGRSPWTTWSNAPTATTPTGSSSAKYSATRSCPCSTP